MKIHNIKNIYVPVGLSGPILINELYIPRYWSLIYDITHCLSLALGTRKKKLRAINSLYLSAERQRFDIDKVIYQSNFTELRLIFQGFLTELNNKTSVDGKDRTEYWEESCKFVEKIISISNHERLPEYYRLNDELESLKYLFKGLRPGKNKKQVLPRALKADVIAELYEIFDYNSNTNPFRGKSSKVRNYLIFIMLLHIGLRTGELLSLPINAVNFENCSKSGNIRYWINITNNCHIDIDSRDEAVDLKNEFSTRQLPISETIYKLITLYIHNYRASSDHPFMFSSLQRKPLSSRQLRNIFSNVSSCLSDEAKKIISKSPGKNLISAHDLRHTAAVFRLSKLREIYSSSEAMDRLRKWFGWAPKSSMPLRYASAYFESTLDEIWNDNLDDYTDVLRKIN